MIPELKIRILSLTGVAIALYQSWLHIRPASGVPALCDLSQYWSCTTVMNSSYGYAFGVPVAWIGLAGFSFLFLLTLFRPSDRRNAMIVAGALGGGLFSAYLTYAEFFILGMACPLCLAVFFIIWAVALTAIMVWGRHTWGFLSRIEVVD